MANYKLLQFSYTGDRIFLPTLHAYYYIRARALNIKQVRPSLRSRACISVSEGSFTPDTVPRVASNAPHRMAPHRVCADYTVSQKKNDNDVLRYNFNAHQPILIIFGRDIAE